MSGAWQEEPRARGLYRDPQRGKIAGVCAGLADYFGVEIWIVRLLAISGLIFAGFITFFAYCAAWLLLDKRPQRLVDDGILMKERSWQAGSTPRQALARVSRELESLEPRLQTLERLVTSREFNLRREFNKL
ncbi:envelope stress response membrane protein PspC [Aeromonas simiae]|uniref:envelope stress response membrane protein PspC n=1 Tax=Aeromonas simiae TaxID=218936 RepID=UPI0005AB54C8|nr:envelope stress response membrane protein PspC [Aeromonas simiae]MDO2951992.1 envelope stress response membrane protein PspC [Aeromonas simiae]